MLTVRPLVSAGVGLLVLLVSPCTAFAWDNKPTQKAATSGNTITVTVVGTGVKGGSAGHAGSQSVSVPAPCAMMPGFTGKEYYEWVHSGKAVSEWHHTGGDLDGPFEPQPGYEKYKDDDKGHWYGGSCSSETFSDMDDFFDYADKWFAAHKSVYVPAGTRPPAPPVPPELLRDVAARAMTLPLPAINWNPKRNGDLSTLVNIDTWVWLTDRDANRYVEASADSDTGRVTARVDANLQSMTVRAAGVPDKTCQNGGVPWSDGATGECSIRFPRSSPGGGTTAVTTQTSWFATWSLNGADKGAIPVQPTGPAAVTNIGVREVQVPNR
jgi:hypothetical protein